MPSLGGSSVIQTRTRQAIRNTIIVFNPSLIESTDLTIDQFITDFVRDDNGLYQFRINPLTVAVSKSKLTATVLTEAGFERAYFGNALTTMRFSGNTGHFWMPTANWVGSGLSDDIRISSVWQKFLRFELFFEHMDNDIYLVNHRGDIYRGAITQFSYEERGDRPWSIDYSMTVEAYTDELGRQKLGDAIKRLAFLAMLGQATLPQLLVQEMIELFGPLGVVLDNLPGRGGPSDIVFKGAV